MISRKQFHEYQISSLTLGTAQLGMNYGIANRLGQPSYESAREMIACAHQGGVNCLDTASMYGSSEEVIGRALSELKIADQTVVVTKARRHLEGDLSVGEADRLLEESVTSSLKRLRLDALPICLLHVEEHFAYMDSLAKLKDRGLVKHIGISVNTPGAALTILQSGRAEVMQLPFSALDNRFSQIRKDAATSGLAIFARSIFLQGLLLMPENEIREDLREVIPTLRDLRLLAADAGITLPELAVRYALGAEGILGLVVGAESPAQVKQNIELFEKGPLDADLMRAVENAVPRLPDSIIMPIKWKQQ